MVRKEAAFGGRLVITGFGSIGQGALPLLLRHIDIRPDQVTVIKAHADDLEIADAFGVQHRVAPLERDSYREVLEPHLGHGDFLLNLSVDVSSTALIAHCREKGALYLDTCIEPWPGTFTDESRPLAERTNYALRESALALHDAGAAQPTAVLTRGANPGLVSHFVKQALLNIARDGGPAQPDYRPTVHYAYHPCDDAVLSLHELAARNWRPQDRERLIRDEIVSGHDELGVLLMGHARGAYWYGSQLTVEAARAACPYNSATSLQVAAPVMAGVVWALNNPGA